MLESPGWCTSGGGTVRLWSLSPVGAAALSDCGPVPSLRCAPSVESSDGLPKLRRQSPQMAVAAYRALGSFVAAHGAAVRVHKWEQPWRRTIRSTSWKPAQHLRIPAAALVELVGSKDLLPVLLLPDLGTAPVSSYRPVLRGLVELWRSYPETADNVEEPMLVVAAVDHRDSGERLAAWRALLGHVAARAGESSIRALVLGMKDPVELTGPLESRSVSRPTAGRRVSQTEQVLGLLARHPLLTRSQLADLSARRRLASVASRVS